jgi:hypothetical protein
MRGPARRGPNPPAGVQRPWTALRRSIGSPLPGLDDRGAAGPAQLLMLHGIRGGNGGDAGLPSPGLQRLQPRKQPAAVGQAGAQALTRVGEPGGSEGRSSARQARPAGDGMPHGTAHGREEADIASCSRPPCWVADRRAAPAALEAPCPALRAEAITARRRSPGRPPPLPGPPGAFRRPGSVAPAAVQRRRSGCPPAGRACPGRRRWDGW